jgi:hypothetical protein
MFVFSFLVALPGQSPSAQESDLETCTASYTVFQDVSGVGRKNSAARNMTKKHSEMALQGWRFEDLEIYTENNDLEGFFLTYSKDLDCDKIPSEQT